MKLSNMFLALGAAVPLFLSGCANTAEGVKRDASIDSKLSSKSAADAMESATKASRDVTATVSLTAPIKLAINGDSNLNIPENHIDVDSTDSVVKLSGTVVTDADKALAEKIAAQILKDHKAPQSLVNEIKVQPTPEKGKPS